DAAVDTRRSGGGATGGGATGGGEATGGGAGGGEMTGGLTGATVVERCGTGGEGGGEGGATRGAGGGSAVIAGVPECTVLRPGGVLGAGTGSWPSAPTGTTGWDPVVSAATAETLVVVGPLETPAEGRPVPFRGVVSASARMAAPMATTSSGGRLAVGSRPKKW